MQKETCPTPKLTMKNIKTKKLLSASKDSFGAGFVTSSADETRKLGRFLAKELRGGAIICLSGDLGSGKTTFVQGFLKGLGTKGPYTSPTFLIMKKYGENVFHFDTYRVEADDVMNLGWEEIVANNENIVIIEWAEKIKKIIPSDAAWLKFEWVDEDKRKIICNF